MHTSTLSFYDPQTDTHAAHPDAEKVYSGHGCVGLSYHEIYRLAGGFYLSGVRRYGRHGEMTDIRYSPTRTGLFPHRRGLH